MTIMKRSRNEVVALHNNSNRCCSTNEIRREIRLIQAQRQLSNKRHNGKIKEPFQQRQKELEQKIQNKLYEQQQQSSIYKQVWNERNAMMSNNTNNDIVLPEEEQLLFLAHGTEIKDRLLKSMIGQHRTMINYMACEIQILEEERNDMMKSIMEIKNDHKRLEEGENELVTEMITTTFTTPQRNLLAEEEEDEEDENQENHYSYYLNDNNDNNDDGEGYNNNEEYDDDTSLSIFSCSYHPPCTNLESACSIGSNSTNTTVMMDDDDERSIMTSKTKGSISSWFYGSYKKQDNKHVLLSSSMSSSSTMKDRNGFTEISLS